MNDIFLGLVFCGKCSCCLVWPGFKNWKIKSPPWRMTILSNRCFSRF